MEDLACAWSGDDPPVLKAKLGGDILVRGKVFSDASVTKEISWNCSFEATHTSDDIGAELFFVENPTALA